MSARRSVPTRVGPFAVVLVIVVLGVAAWLVVAGRPGPPAGVVSEAGGFSLDLPAGWTVVDPDPAKPLMWASAERVTRAGIPAAWLWVVRWSSDGEGTLEAAADAAVADVRKLWGDVDVARTATRHSGQRAIVLHYSRPYSQSVGDLLPVIPGVDIEELRLVTISAGQVYEIGIGGWRRLPREAAVLDRHVRLMAPEGWRILTDSDLGMQLTTVTSRTDGVIAGRSAVRIDFEQPTPHLARAFFATWHFEGSDGRAWQLLVGGPAPVSALAEMVESTLVLRD